ncbi:hypothetical protein K2X92_05200 [Candidatus Gracilibacteria bacterium]|nr:hypothetical protein [Candidatus Gracilibacteria bacterium]
MTFSRMHLGMLGVVSIFTGMISPVVKNSNGVFAFPLTNMQIPTYLILLSLAIICILLTARAWTGVKLFAYLILASIGYLFIVSWGGEMRTNNGVLAPNLSWGWVFLTIGMGLLIASVFHKNIGGKHKLSLADHLLGWFSACIVLGLTGLIIAVSYTPELEKSTNGRILENIFGSGGTKTISGVTETKTFPSINNFTFDRKQDTISFFSSSGKEMILVPDGTKFDRLPYAISNIGNTRYIVSADGTISNSSGESIGKAYLPQNTKDGILFYSGNVIKSITQGGINTYSGEYNKVTDIIFSSEGNNFVWKNKTASGYVLVKNGNIIGNEEINISHISINKNANSIMALIENGSGAKYIIKNGIKIEKILTGFIENSIKMNGMNSMYAIEQDGYIGLVYNGVLINRKFDEIREIFLDKDGDGYVYFGRPLGEQSYCLYTRYRGNLCGITGYMNPRLSADGSSVIYAALKDGTWGIYRNASPIISNTGYMSGPDISQDYAFFDITNPSYYLFIKRIDNGYKLYKKGSWIIGNWKDVGLDISFGYDNKIIMSVEDQEGWKIIEF